MAYWIVKARPDNAGRDFLRKGKSTTWHTKRPPRSLAKGDRLFFWVTAPDMELVGFGEVAGSINLKHRGEESSFRVRFLTNRLSRPLGIDELRKLPELSNASFLKAGPSGTLFPISETQADILMVTVEEMNKALPSIWNIDTTLTGSGVPDLESTEIAGVEGRRIWKRHLRIERDRKLVAKKKIAAQLTFGTISCEACGLQFEKLLEGLGRACCEVHHVRPLGEIARPGRTMLSDLSILCANCHRMIHRKKPMPTVAQFKKMRQNGA